MHSKIIVTVYLPLDAFSTFASLIFTESHSHIGQLIFFMRLHLLLQVSSTLKRKFSGGMDVRLGLMRGFDCPQWRLLGLFGLQVGGLQCIAPQICLCSLLIPAKRCC